MFFNWLKERVNNTHSCTWVKIIEMWLPCLQWWFNALIELRVSKCIIYQWIHHHLFHLLHWLSWNLICFCMYFCKMAFLVTVFTSFIQCWTRSSFFLHLLHFLFSDFCFSFNLLFGLLLLGLTFSVPWWLWLAFQTFLDHGHSQVML